MALATVTALPTNLANEMKHNGVWQEGSPVPLNRLSLITVSYFDFAGKEHHDGEMVCLDVVAPLAAAVFPQLHQIRFPINKIKSIHHYEADDEASMADNNSSAYCFRPIARTARISVHSYGVAIDLNPVQNPYVVLNDEKGIAEIHPKSGCEFLNRHLQKPGMVESIVSLWTEHGFLVWGGQWSTPIDYQHFQLHRGTAELLTVMTAEDGKLFIEATLGHRDKLSKLDSMPCGEALQPIIELYKKNKSDFFDRWTEFLL